MVEGYVHRKVLVNHIDGNKLNNNVSNLEWCTAQENYDHAVRSGAVPKAMTKIKENNLATLLSNVGIDVVQDIVSSFVSGCRVNGLRALGRKHGIGRCTVKYIIDNAEGLGVTQP